MFCIICFLKWIEFYLYTKLFYNSLLLRKYVIKIQTSRLFITNLTKSGLSVCRSVLKIHQRNRVKIDFTEIDGLHGRNLRRPLVLRNVLGKLLICSCLIKVERGWLSYIIKRWNIILWTYLSIVTSIFLVQGCLHSKRRQNWTLCHVQRKSKTSLFSYLIALFLSAKFK